MCCRKYQFIIPMLLNFVTLSPTLRSIPQL